METTSCIEQIKEETPIPCDVSEITLQKRRFYRASKVTEPKRDEKNLREAQVKFEQMKARALVVSRSVSIVR